MKNAIFDPDEYIRNGGVIIDYDPAEEVRIIKVQRKIGLLAGLIGITLLFVCWPIGVYLTLIGFYVFETDKKFIRERK